MTYEGNFTNGEFHGDGSLIKPNGVSLYKLKELQGRYIAKWDRGKLIEETYFYFDNLEYVGEPKDDGANYWSYCTNNDRRLCTEVMKGLRPDGLTLTTNATLREPVRSTQKL